MKKSWYLLALLAFGAVVAHADPKSEIESKLVADIGKRLQQFKTPEEVLAKLQPTLKEADAKYIKTLIETKKWVELPASVKSEKNVLNLEFSGDLTFAVEITNPWTGEFKLNGYQLTVDRYSSVEEELAYIRRVVKTKLPSVKDQSKGALLYSIMFPYAHASLTCNALVSSGCVEVSVAATLWFIKTVSAESPIARCRDIYYFNKYNDVTAKCMQEYKNNPTLSTIQELSEMLAGAPGASVSIACGKSEGPTIWIGDNEVIKLGRGAMASDYNITQAQDPQFKLRNLPALAIKCCKQSKSDPLAGQCEEFVSSHLGSSGKRKSEFKDPNLRIRGEALPGVR